MTLLRFLLSLFAFIGALAAAGALVFSVVLMLRFPPLLVAVVLACWILCKLLRILRMPGQSQTKNVTASE
jgi:fatty acid desaturase